MTQITSATKSDKYVLIPEEILTEILFKLDLIISDQKISPYTFISDDWLDEKEAQELMGKKTTSLWKLRKSKSIASSKIGSRIFYQKESILRLLEENQH